MISLDRFVFCVALWQICFLWRALLWTSGRSRWCNCEGGNSFFVSAAKSTESEFPQLPSLMVWMMSRKARVHADRRLILSATAQPQTEDEQKRAEAWEQQRRQHNNYLEHPNTINPSVWQSITLLRCKGKTAPSEKIRTHLKTLDKEVCFNPLKKVESNNDKCKLKVEQQ